MQFQPDQIVWGKIKGYPYWPCRILYFSNDKYRVVFYGDNSQGELAEPCVKSFEENFQSLARAGKKDKNFSKALRLVLAEDCLAHLRENQKLPMVPPPTRNANLAKLQKYLEKLNKLVSQEKLLQLFDWCS